MAMAYAKTPFFFLVRAYHSATLNSRARTKERERERKLES